MAEEFEQELMHLLNKTSMENDSNTPDFILASYLLSCLNAFNVAVRKREHWYTEPIRGESFGDDRMRQDDQQMNEGHGRILPTAPLRSQGGPQKGGPWGGVL